MRTAFPSTLTRTDPWSIGIRGLVQAPVDVNLRDGQTGPTIANQLAERDGTRVIYVTANPAQIDPIAETAIGYIQKPFSAAAIRAAAAIADGKQLSNDPGCTELKLFNRDASSS